jgi:Prealbumin-like fold domain
MAAFKFHRRKTRRWWYTGATLVAAALFGVFYVAGAGALSTSPSGFETNDGSSGTAANMIVDANNHADWNCFANDSLSNFVSSGINQAASGVTGACSALSSGNSANAIENTDPNAGTADDVGWVSGQKMDLQCAQTKAGNQPAKDTFNNIAQYNETAPGTGHLFLYGAAIRATANGNANENIELSKQAGDTTCPIKRSDGDKLLQFNYSGSGGVSLQILTYYVTTAIPVTTDNPTGSCFANATHSRPCWAHPVDASSDVDGGTNNTNTINAADNGINGKDLGLNLFSEFGVDLTDALSLGVSCSPFAQETWESRSSSSFSSNPEDIEIISHTISTCGSITIVKHTDPGGLDQVFNYTSSNLPPNSSAGGVTCAGKSGAGVNSDGTFCLNDKTSLNTGTGTANHITEGSLLPGNYTVTEGSDPTGFQFESLYCYGGSYGTQADPTPIYSSGTTTFTKSVTIALASGDNVTCTYKNKQLLGAILITKRGKYASCTTAGAAIKPDGTNQIGVCGPTGSETNAFLGGAQFQVSPNADLSGPLGTFTTSTSTGKVCIGGLTFGNYYVKETSAPSGYALDSSSIVGPINVSASATCKSDGSDVDTGTAATPASAFTDTPLTDLQVKVTSETKGAVNASVSCTHVVSGSATPISGSPQPASGKTDPVTLTSNGLKPTDTITCIISIDP